MTRMHETYFLIERIEGVESAGHIPRCKILILFHAYLNDVSLLAEMESRVRRDYK